MQKIQRGILPNHDDITNLLGNLSSIKWHDEIIQNATDLASSIPDVIGILLKGSLGKKEGDAFSDIDFYIIHSGNHKTSSSIMEQFLARVDEIGDFLFYFTYTNPIRQSIFYKPYVNLELNIRPLEEAGSRDNAFAEILYDPEGKMKKLKEDAQQMVLKPDMHQIRNTAVALPAFCYIIAGHLVRGEWICAMNEVRMVANMLLTINGWMLGYWNEGSRRAERKFPEKVLDFYRGMFTSSPEGLWSSFEAALNWYLEILIPGFEEMGVKHSAYQIPTIRNLLAGLQTEFQNRYRNQG